MMFIVAIVFWLVFLFFLTTYADGDCRCQEKSPQLSEVPHCSRRFAKPNGQFLRERGFNFDLTVRAAAADEVCSD